MTTDTYNRALDDARRQALHEAAQLVRCDCCESCGESPEYEHVCANVLAKQIELLAAGRPHSIRDARAALAKAEVADG